MPALPARAPARRLDTLQKSTLGRPKGVQRTVQAKKASCCDDPKIEDEDGLKVCKNCFTQISESNIVADVTFQEDTRGAATVQGGFVGENARHARTLGAAAFRRMGGGDRNTVQVIESNGKRALNALCPRLSVPDDVQRQAISIWTLAAGNNFNAGRKTDEVVAACLYAACRRQKDNTILFMDISEVQRINVFRLGEVYKDLCRALFLGGDEVGVQHLVEVEPLIIKYCRKLEFGEATKQVAEDAIKIIRRMKRDWMVTGRHPAGLCGACIILAARMNNFRRTVREVVYVSKVANMTISTRIAEFRRTKSASLSVEQFREYGVRLKHQHDPPSMNLKQTRDEKFEEKKRKRQAESIQRDTIEISDDGSDTSSRAPSTTLGPETPTPTPDTSDRRKRQRLEGPQSTPTPTQQEPRYDADGFAIPALPSVRANSSAPPQQPKRGRGRPRKDGTYKADDLPPPVKVTEDELIEEAELEHEIEEDLADEQLLHARNELERAKIEERAKSVAEEQKQLAAKSTEARRDAEGVNWWKDKEVVVREEVTKEELEVEFADDPEVNNCELTEMEKKIKEQIWVAHNEDWLRTQKEKDIIAQILKATGGAEKPKRGAKGVRKKRSKMGDGTVLTEAGTPIETPADASAAMIAKRAPPAFSKYVNYEALAKVYGGSPSTSTSASRVGSEVPTTDGSRLSASPAPTRRIGMQSPPATQATRVHFTTPQQPQQQTSLPATPGPTQQATEGADADDDVGDYASEAPSEVGGWDGEESEREDIGEEDYGRALSNLGRASLGNQAYNDDDEYYI